MGLIGASPESQDEVQGRLLLYIVVSQCAPILELLPCKDQPLLVRRDPFLVLDLRFYVVNGVRRLAFEGDGLSGQGLHKNLHAVVLYKISF